MKKVAVRTLALLSVFCTAVLAQDNCGPIGSNDDTALTRRRDRMFYLNSAHPAPCSGNITSWKVCYYGPDSIDFSSYWATYAVYRRRNSDGIGHYERISSTFRAVRATGLLANIDSTGTIDGSIQQGGFVCYNDNIGAGIASVTVQAGDVIGACIFDPEDSENFDRRQLDIIGEIDGESLLAISSSGCTTDTLPTNIPVSQLTTISSRRLHLYANIESREVPITTTIAAGSTAPVTTQAQQTTEALATPPANASPVASTTTHVRATDSNASTMASLPRDQLSPTTPLDIQGTDSSDTGSGGLPFEAIVSLVVGSLLSLLLGVFLAAVVFCLMRCRRPCCKTSRDKIHGFDNMIYGTTHEERKHDGEITSTSGDVESGVHEIPGNSHDYELTSGSTYAIPYEVRYSTQGPSEEMLANAEHYYSPLNDHEAAVSYTKLLERDKQVDIYGNIEEYLQPPTGEIELYAQLKSCGIRHIPCNHIQVKRHLGSGQFGSVEQGLWKNGSIIIPVALKLLKERASEMDKVKFLQEAAIMAQFMHPNVVSLYGVVSKGEPLMLVVELVQKGDLRNYLHTIRPDPGQLPAVNLSKLLLSFSEQVALGMHYLSAKRFVHRDLAARNILVSNDNICKVADFGLSRDLADETYYVSQGGKVPVKWTAPEAIHYMKYSTASDVWSYGCLLYEIWSLGHKPFEKVGNDEMIELVDSGKRLPPPPGSSRIIYELMIKCWNPVVAQRPSFRELLLTLLGSPEEVLSIPTDALDTHNLAGVLGSPLKTGEAMYLDLQNRYMDSDHDYQEVD